MICTRREMVGTWGGGGGNGRYMGGGGYHIYIYIYVCMYVRVGVDSDVVEETYLNGRKHSGRV